MALIDRCAGLRPGPITSPLAAANHSLRGLARRWRDLHEEITGHEALLDQLVRDTAPQLVEAFGVRADTAAEVLIVAGDNPERVRGETAWAKLCGVAPIPASSGMTTRHRLNRGGHRQANAAIYRAVIVRMQHHDATRAYVARRTADGRTKPEIIRCLKRYVAREIWALLKPLRQPAVELAPPVDGYRSINALMENFFSTLRTELVYRTSWRTPDEAENALFAYIDGWYNTKRIQARLGWLSPNEDAAAWHAQTDDHPAADAAEPDPATTRSPTLRAIGGSSSPSASPSTPSIETPSAYA